MLLMVSSCFKGKGVLFKCVSDVTESLQKQKNGMCEKIGLN